MPLEDIIERINEEFSKSHLPKIQEFLRQPSVSATGEGIHETTEILVEKIKNKRRFYRMRLLQH